MTDTVTLDSPAAAPAAAFPLTLANARVGVVGLGYVGLPVAVAFGQKFPTVGIDIKPARIANLKAGHDETKEATPAELAAATQLSFTSDWADVAGCNVFIVTVPTPLNGHNHPDLGPLKSATKAIGKVLKRELRDQFGGNPIAQSPIVTPDSKETNHA